MNTGSEQKLISEYVSRLNGMRDNLKHGSLQDRVVADWSTGDPKIHDAALRAGARLCYVVGNGEVVVSDPRLVRVPGDLWDASITGVDVAFLDVRFIAGFDTCTDLRRLIHQLRRALSPGGLVFAVLMTGNGLGGFEVSNPIVQTPVGPLPSTEYLLDELLGDWALRTLDWIPSQHATISTRFVRLAPKKPSLLLIVGPSQSGKTTLSRDFAQLDRHLHISNDYVYCEIVRLKNSREKHRLPPSLLEIVGDGGGEACGLFNRALENNTDLMHQYLIVVESVLPRNKPLISMDFDLRTEQKIDYVKSFFLKIGYSVWVVKR